MTDSTHDRHMMERSKDIIRAVEIMWLSRFVFHVLQFDMIRHRNTGPSLHAKTMDERFHRSSARFTCSTRHRMWNTCIVLTHEIMNFPNGAPRPDTANDWKSWIVSLFRCCRIGFTSWFRNSARYDSFAGSFNARVCILLLQDMASHLIKLAFFLHDRILLFQVCCLRHALAFFKVVDQRGCRRFDAKRRKSKMWSFLRSASV